MKRVIYCIILLIAALLFCFWAEAQGMTWYVAKSSSSSNNGKSWANAFTDIEVMEDSVDAGDTVRFGTVTLTTSQLNPIGGSSGAPTVYACSTLTESSFGFVTITSGEPLTSWSVHSGYIYKTYWHRSSRIGYGEDNYNANKAYVMTVNDSDLYAQITLGEVDHPGMFFQDPATDTVYAWLWGNANPSGKTCLISGGPTMYISGGTNYVTFIGLNFKMGKQGVVEIGYSDYLTFNHCLFQHMSNRSSYEANNPSLVITLSHDHKSHHLTFTSCDFRDCYHEGFPKGTQYTQYDHGGTGLKFYNADNCVIESCSFMYCAGDGIKFKSTREAYSRYNTVRYNLFFGNLVLPMTESFTYHGTNTSLTNAAILFHAEIGDDSAYGNIITNTWSAFELGELGAHGGDWNDTNMGGNFLCNNTAYNTSKHSLVYDGYKRPGVHDMFRYNVFYNNMTSTEAQVIIRCLAVGNSAMTTELDIDSNLYYDATHNFNARDVNCNAEIYDSSSWVADGYDVHSHFRKVLQFDSSYSIDDTTTNLRNILKRSAADTEMTVTYGGKTWYQLGAIQTLDTAVVSHETTFTISGTITLDETGLSAVSILGVTTNGSGVYSATRDSAWSGTATPILSGYTFSPSSRSYSGLSSNQLSQNYTATAESAPVIPQRIKVRWH